MISCLSAIASAESNVDTEEGHVAEGLFADAKRLMAEGDYDQACPKLAESHRLDPGGGTVLNLAVCHEAQARNVDAWAEFQEARSMARTSGRSDREAVAAEHMEKLATKIAFLAVAVRGAADVADVEVTIDARRLDRRAWGTSLPIDPGPHDVRISAPGRRAQHVSVFLSASDRNLVRVGPLGPLSSDPPPMQRIEEEAVADRPNPTLRTVVSVSVFGAGLLSIALGAYAALQSQRDAKDASAVRGGLGAPTGCLGANAAEAPCRRLHDLVDTQRRDATVSEVLYVGGGVMLAAAAALWFAWPRAQDKQDTALRIAPAFSERGGVLLAVGAF